jgi:hypothetical protein
MTYHEALKPHYIPLSAGRVVLFNVHAWGDYRESTVSADNLFRRDLQKNGNWDAYIERVKRDQERAVVRLLGAMWPDQELPNGKLQIVIRDPGGKSGRPTSAQLAARLDAYA